MVRQTAEARVFIQRINALPDGPGVCLDSVLRLSINDETKIRRIFASESNRWLLLDLNAGLVDVFEAPASIRTTRARIVTSRSDRFAKHLLPVPEGQRRKEGAPSIVSSLSAFRKNWDAFTEKILECLDWENVVAAGGAVLAAILPLPQSATSSNRALRNHYQDAFPSSDIDLFLYGLDEEEAKAKILHIHEAIRDAVPYEVTLSLTKYTVSFKAPSPYRTVQVVLRLYRSPAEVIASFDIDSACFLYDGYRVYANPRAIVATMRQSNTIDMSHHSPSFEIRLAKYATRGFEIYLQTLDCSRLDAFPCWDSSPKGGLAMLAVFEWQIDGCQSLSEMRQRLDVYLNERRKRGKASARPVSQIMTESYSQLCHPAVSTSRLNIVLDGGRALSNFSFSFWKGSEGSTTVNPPSIDEWCAEAYLGDLYTFFEAIKTGDRRRVNDFLEKEDFDPNKRDASRNTALRLAVLSGNEGIASDILDAGAAPDIGMEVFVNKLVEAVLTREEEGSDDSGDSEYLSGIDEDAITIPDTDEEKQDKIPCECSTCNRRWAEDRDDVPSK